ncbi:MAG TPA: right-handed parallel beta-helix repeat-containing protein, partial [Mycobacterium sp.]|nr:right-handed parallel beta-helix repeat-containing protein [Mycobacterium sp.]
PTVVPAIEQLDPLTGLARAGPPTLVLPGPASYGITDLLAAGAALPIAEGGFLLVDSVLVAPGATLKLGGTDVPRLLMNSSTEGFTSLVTWGGTLILIGADITAPLEIVGWDHATGQPAADRGYGRPYIRAVGGRMELAYVRASNLGFWSGRTGGVAWTGISGKPSTGSAVFSRFIGNTYGTFASRASYLVFTDDLFEGNELDGLRLHRNAIESTVANSTSARNGGNGFVVSRGATGNVIRGALAVNNRGNGFLVNGLPLVSGASPSGGQAAASIGTIVQDSDAEGNGRTGILIEGGAGTIIRRNIVCGTVTGIAVRAGASDTMLVGNEVRCGGRVAMSIGPSVVGTTVAGNTLNAARIGLLIRNSPGVRIMNNHITNVSVFGISVRGVSPGVVGNDNIIAGRGFQPIDTRGGAASPTITTTDLSGWQHRSSLSMVESLRYHPLLVTWLAVAVFVVVSSVLIRFRRRPARPYYYTVPWRPTAPPTNGHAHPTEPAASIAATVLVATNSSKPKRRRKQAPQPAALVDAKSHEVSA